MSVIEREYRLPPFSELCIVTSSRRGQGTTVVLHDPSPPEAAGPTDRDTAGPRADIFGAELPLGAAVRLPAARSLRVFSPGGCALTVTAPPAVLQRCVATASNAVWTRSLLDLHAHLEGERAAARAAGDVGPRALFVSDRRWAGTSTYARTLAHYAVRLGYHPLLLDAASDHPQFGYASCLSLYQLQYTLDVEEETSYLPGVHTFVGKSAKTTAAGLYLHALQQLVALGMEKIARNDRCRVGGLFMDYGVVHPFEVDAAEQAVYECDQKAASGEARGSGALPVNPLDTLLDTIVEADIDHVFVVESAWLRFKLAQRALERFGDSEKVGRMTLAPSVVESSGGPCFRLFLLDGLDSVNIISESLLARQRWLRYFFGSETSPVKPILLHLDASAVRIASFGALALGAMATLMPMTDEEAESGEGGRGPVAVSFLTVRDVELKGRVLAVSTATEMETSPDGTLQRLPYAEFERRVRQCTIMGFALVESASDERITVLVNAAPLPKELGLCFLLTNEYLLS